MTASTSGPATESATSRLSRLLTMVPWLLNRQGIEIEEAAREFGVSPAQMEADLELLFVCGTPGHMPDDLIEAEWEGGRVYLGNADTIARPLRLGVDEALALIVGLRALAAVPGLGERDAVDRALAKLEAATGSASAASARIQVSIEGDAAAESLATARTALAGRRRLHLRYLVAARDEATERDVDPMRVVNIDAHWYLEGWCHVAEGVRLFRFDRIEAIDILDEDGTPPADARPRDLDSGVFTPEPDRPAGPAAAGARRGLGQRLLPDRAGGVARGRQLAGLAAHGRHRVAAPAAVAPGVAGHRARAGLPRGRGAGRRRAGPGGLRGPRPDLAAGRVGWSTCGGGC